MWVGTSSNGYSVDLVVLENGDTWGVYMSGGYIYGAVFGNTASSGNQLSGSMLDFNIPKRTVLPGTYTGSFTAKSNVSVRFSNGLTVAGSYNPVYDQPPAPLSTIAGTYTGSAVTGTTMPQTISVAVSSSGTITLPTTQGCGATGTIQPRASGKNIYDVTLRFQGSTCALGNGVTVRGGAYYDPASHVVLVLALNGAKTDGFIYSAKK